MKAIELMNELFALGGPADYSNTCDTLKSGDPNRTLKKVAVSCFATPAVIRQCAEWGADLLIVHEPTFYDHMDHRLENDRVTELKLALLKESGITLYRYHDHPHNASVDMICAGELKYLDLPGQFKKGRYFGSNRYTLDEPITPRQLARRMEEKLGIAHVRICGSADQPCRRIATCFGTPGGVFEELQSDEIDIVLTGEACEWKLGEYARDAAELGLKKALLIMGHIGSERDGMRYLADQLAQEHNEFETRYFECGEVYTYSERA